MDETTKMKMLLKLIRDLNPAPDSCKQLASVLIGHSIDIQIMREAIEMSEYGKEECFPERDYYKAFKEAIAKAKDQNA